MLTADRVAGAGVIPGSAHKMQTPIAFKQGEEFRRFFDADARRLATGVARAGRVETKEGK